MSLKSYAATLVFCNNRKHAGDDLMCYCNCNVISKNNTFW